MIDCIQILGWDNCGYDISHEVFLYNDIYRKCGKT